MNNRKNVNKQGTVQKNSKRNQNQLTKAQINARVESKKVTDKEEKDELEDVFERIEKCMENATPVIKKADIAKACSVDDNTVNNWFKRHSFKLKLLVGLHEKYGMDLNAIICGDTSPEKNNNCVETIAKDLDNLSEELNGVSEEIKELSKKIKNITKCE